jgi:hypothetical protein
LEDIKRIDHFIKDIKLIKPSENHHKSDNSSLYQRFFTGTLGELALEKFLGVDGIVNWDVGDSKDFHKSDLKRIGLSVGIKTVRYGQFPVIFKKNYNHEIIMIRWQSRYVYVCGLAKKEILNKYQSDDLIVDPKLKERGTKTGFYGFEHLLPIGNLDNLKQISK